MQPKIKYIFYAIYFTIALDHGIYTNINKIEWIVSQPFKFFKTKLIINGHCGSINIML